MTNKIQPPDRDTIAEEYFGQLPFSPYPVQEEALLAWYTAEQGVLVCAPTGTGKTLIAEAAIYEALRTGKQCYYTTPLIALSDQKLIELQESAVRWGFQASDIGLVTGNRRVNPDAPVLVVVAEILLNRLMHHEAFAFDRCHAVVMDEFHSFNDPERGIVWELTLGMLPDHIRLLLLSATIGNSMEFCSWLNRAHGRRLQLVQGTERKVPLSFEWVEDAYLDEHLERIAEGDEAKRRTPGLVFCFNRDQCWQVAELLKGKKLIDKVRQLELAHRLEEYDLSQGAGPKMRAVLQRGIGVHHAGILPKYRRIVEELFQAKLLSVAVCTETLSSGINLPARSVILPTILKGPRDKKKLIEASSAHQIFGRAGRPQYDTQGFVYALAHEDDVKYLRWKEKYDSIPEDTKDPGLLRAKKQLKKKMPKRRQGESHWTAGQFEALRVASPTKLSSRGSLPWRLLAYLLLRSPEVQPIRDLVSKRLMERGEIEVAQRELNQMLITLWAADYLHLDPKPSPLAKSEGPTPKSGKKQSVQEIAQGLFDAMQSQAAKKPAIPANEKTNDEVESDAAIDDRPTLEPTDDNDEELESDASIKIRLDDRDDPMARGYELTEYRPMTATPTDRAEVLLQLRSVNPIYGVFMANHLTIADPIERIQVLESALELPANISRLVRVPPIDVLPPGTLATTRLHGRLLELGLATAAELTGKYDDDDEEDGSMEELATGRYRSRRMFDEPPPRPLALGEKLRRLFDYDFPRVHDVYTRSVWVVGELLEFDGQFNKYVTSRGLQKQEGILFRHVLRFILLCDEFASIPPFDTTPETWEDPLDEWIERLTICCRAVDPESTDEVLENGLGNQEIWTGDSPKATRRRPLGLGETEPAT
ncbi:MAG: DEAD/DEAH box helicase [Pirellulaceae bacterium]|nr:DEAD/DEAH box helicase [Pirellulaceae bacterium]